MDYLRLKDETFEQMKNAYLANNQKKTVDELDKMDLIEKIVDLNQQITDSFVSYEALSNKDMESQLRIGYAGKISILKIQREFFLKLIGKSCESIAVMCYNPEIANALESMLLNYGVQCIFFKNLLDSVRSLSRGMISSVILIDVKLNLFVTEVRKRFPWAGAIPIQFAEEKAATSQIPIDIKDVKFDDTGVKTSEPIIDKISNNKILSIYCFYSDQINEIVEKVLELNADLPQHYLDYNSLLEAKKNESSAEATTLTEKDLTDKDINHADLDEDDRACCANKIVLGKAFQGHVGSSTDDDNK